MKLIFIFLQCIFVFSLYGQTLTAKFSADNCYAIYTGNQNSTTVKVMPYGGQNSIVNSQAPQIFNATVKSNITYSPGDYLYVIAWADDKACQGLIGEFTANTTIKTGDSGWEVYPTGKDFTISNAPNKVLIDQMITQANSGNKWVAPFVGKPNNQSNQVCSQFSSVSKVQGISDDCKWVWHNSGRHNNPKAPFAAYNHDEFLIFRFPIKLISGPTNVTPAYNVCCPPFDLDELQEMLTIKGGFSTHRVKFTPTQEWRKKMQAYVNWRCALNPCLESFSFNLTIRKPKAGTVDQFDFAQNTNISGIWIAFKAGDPNNTCFVGNGYTQSNNGAHEFNIDLPSNQWHKIHTGIWGNSIGSGTTCPGWDKDLCNPVGFKYNLFENNQKSGKIQENYTDTKMKMLDSNKIVKD